MEEFHLLFTVLGSSLHAPVTYPVTKLLLLPVPSAIDPFPSSLFHE